MTKTPFEEYLLAEYQHIAEAHFKTIATISDFFRYYLTIMAIPVTLFSVAFGLSTTSMTVLSPQTLDRLDFLLAGVSLAISLIGYLVLIYVVNLRLDALLYARTVNSIRKHFYDKSNLELATALRTRILPQTAVLPQYLEKNYFLPVVLAFTAFNTFYFGLSIVFFRLPLTGSPFAQVPFIFLALIVSFFVSHPVTYALYSNYRETAYLRSYIFGVDIDGVLNDHRKMFCKLLKELTDKDLKPEEITVIPVHEDSKLNVTRDDERKVFNDLRYWIEMPALSDASENIRRLRNSFKLKIYIFTYRPWPTPKVRESSDYDKWKNSASEMQPLSQNSNSLGVRFALWKAISKVRLWLSSKLFRVEPIDMITRAWLKSNGFEFDNLIIEKGSEDVSDPRAEFRNRFYISRKKRIRFFIEDDPEKANKLAYICDVVFLMDQPYNQSQNFANNIIRVKSWDQIYKEIRKLS